MIQIKDWRKLEQLVNQGLKDFKQQWQERSLQRRSRSDWATTDVVDRGGEKEKMGINEKAIFPGSIMKLALGERFRSVNVYIRDSGNLLIRPSSRSEWQQRLCKVLVDVCMPERSTEVNPVAIMETANHVSYLKLEVRGNRTIVGNVLEWREIGFVVEIRGLKNKAIKKHFAINLQSKRSRRSLTTGSIDADYDFPDYKQHKCCGCLSGCSPVAWAQVFGYYDRRARKIPDFSPNIYGDRSIVAPKTLTDDVKRFVEDIRDEIHTYCDNGEGATKRSKMHYIAKWFRDRQGSNTHVASYVESRKRRAARRNVGSFQRGGSSWIASKAVYYLGHRYPVVLSITVEGGGGHSVVATKYKKRSTTERQCGTRKTGWWLGRKTKQHCYWKTVYDYEFFLHYGWGGRNNKWQEVGLKGAYCAYLV